MDQELSIGAREEVEASFYDRDHAPPGLASAAGPVEERFGIRFDTLAHFPEALFARLHAIPQVPPALPPTVLVASLSDPELLQRIGIFIRVANTPNPSSNARLKYLDALLEVYRRLPRDPARLLGDPNTLCVGIEREGATLAARLHRLPAGRSIRPHAKRILFEGGLVVGLRGVEADRTYSQCVITDGAIASGATLMATMHGLRPWVRSFHVFSVHAPWQGLVGLTRYADEAGLDLHLTVGHATAGMSKKYYATLPGPQQRLVIGDIGDTIDGVA